MNEWMHCNRCSLKYNSNIKLFLTECGHLFCQRCVEKIKESKCTVCEKSTSIMELSKDLDFAIQQFFLPFEMVFKKALEVYNFQTQHRSRLFQIMIQKYNFAKKECISCHNQNKNLARENKMLRTMLMSAGQNPHPFLTSTPAVTSDNSQGINMSAMSSIGFTPNVYPGTDLNAGPGYAQRILSGGDRNVRFPHYPPHMYSGGSNQRPAPAQRVSNIRRPMAPIHRPPGTASSLEQLRRVGKRT